MEPRRTTTINISDEEKSPEHTPNAAETGESQTKVAQEEQPKVADPKEPVQAGHQEQEEPRTDEPETEARKGLEPERRSRPESNNNNNHHNKQSNYPKNL